MNATEKIGRAIRKIFGGIFKAVGGLIMMASVALTLADVINDQADTFIPVIICGLIGVGIYWWGKELSKPALPVQKSSPPAKPGGAGGNSFPSPSPKKASAPAIMIPCEMCEKEISSAAEKCPGCAHPVTEQWVASQRKQQTQSIRAGWFFILGIAALFAVFSMLGGFDSSPQQARNPNPQKKEDSASRKKAACGHEIEALTFAQIAVEQKLKSPADAEFPWDDQVITKMGECEYAVKSYVDAPNSYGVKTRTHFVVRLRYDKEQESWIIQDVRF